METTWPLIFILTTTFAGLVRMQNLVTPVSVLEGSSAVLPCESAKYGRTCEWTRVDRNTGESEGIVASQQTVSSDDFPGLTGELTDRPTEGICTLKLNNIPLKAAGDYTCRIKGVGFIVKVTLEVGVLPSRPRIYYNGLPIDDGITHEIIDGENQFTCKVETGIPKATLNWEPEMGGTTIEETDGSVTNTLTIRSEELYALSVPEKTITCFATQKHFPQEVATATATVGLPYAPTNVRVKLADGSQSADKGPGVILYCNSNGIPSPDYEWRSKKKGDDNSMEVKVSGSQNYSATESAVYHCYVRNMKSNNWTKSSGSITINGERVVVTDDGDSQNASVIAGIVGGAIALIVLIGIILFIAFRRRSLCFKENSRDPPAVNQSSSENGTTHQPLSSLEYNEKDGKGDHNENKEKELVYAQLDLTHGHGNDTKLPKPAEEKTEYAQIKFQPKENPV